MKKLASSLPLQEMIRGALANAQEKLASEGPKEEKVKKLLAYEKKEHGGHIPSIKEEEEEKEEEKAEKMAGARTDIDYIEKLASAVDYIAQNVDAIETIQPGAIQQAMKTASGAEVGAGKGPGALEVSKAIGGTQSHKKDHPKTEDPAESEAHSPLHAAHKGDGKTQVENTMEHAPGGGGLKPTAKYPEHGVLKAAGVPDRYKSVVEKLAGEIKGQAQPAPAPQAKTAGALAKETILKKLAGEDVMKASISAAKDGGALPGEGVLEVLQSGQDGPKASGGPVSGMGNQGRRLIDSNKAAIDYTKGDAKGPQKTQLKEVLDEPALNPSTDSTLKQNLRNTGKAGVKIAAVAALQKIAAKGCVCKGASECSYCQMKKAASKVTSEKKANAMAGYGGGGGASLGGAPAPSMPAGGMGATAEAGASADGCTCGGTGQCRVCKLKAALAAAQAGGHPGAEHQMPPHGAPVEKDSDIAPVGGMY